MAKPGDGRPAGGGVQPAGRLQQAVDPDPHVVPVGRRLDVDVGRPPPDGLGQHGVDDRAGIGRRQVRRRLRRRGGHDRQCTAPPGGQHSVLAGRLAGGKITSFWIARGSCRSPSVPMPDPVPPIVAVPVPLAYAARGRRAVNERAAAVFSALAIGSVLAAGSVCLMLLAHRR